MKYAIRVYDWNPNVTNDISIVNSFGDDDPRTEDTLPEALFGIDIGKVGRFYCENSVIIPLELALKHIAVSPIENGSSTLTFLKKYFHSVKGA